MPRSFFLDIFITEPPLDFFITELFLDFFFLTPAFPKFTFEPGINTSHVFSNFATIV